jgi:hypothetical protein
MRVLGLQIVPPPPPNTSRVSRFGNALGARMTEWVCGERDKARVVRSFFMWFDFVFYFVIV